ncbi:hypothetical protein MMC30_001984 [Trapelia coarctata]|nr:hypothetical protein [Trapelia coarctata]
MDFTPSSYPGSLHHIAHNLIAFEYIAPASPRRSSDSINTLVFVGGLFDGLFTVAYTKTLAASLPPAWRFVQPLPSSSHHGWGTSSLDQDVEQIVQCIRYILTLRPQGKIVLMGHSTGSQDTMHYLLSPLQEEQSPRPFLAGAIMQGGVSDREAFPMLLPEEVYQSSVQVALDYVAEGHGEKVLPAQILGQFFPEVAISARRWLSLMSPPPAHNGQDDYFSSDFGDERLKGTFGRIGATGTPVQILYSEKDQYVPEFVHKEELVERWERVIREGGGDCG